MATREHVQRRNPKIARRASTRATATPTNLAKPGRPVLVATDGSRAAGAAIKFVRAMADAGAWAPEAMTVFEHMPIAIADVVLPPQPLYTEPELTQGVLAVIKRQLRLRGGAAWGLRVEFGNAARSIVDVAHAQKSQLIIIGLGKHGKLARLLGAETTARVCRLTDIPVLAIDASASKLPHTAVVAMDFGESSVRAAREALAVLRPPGRLHLLHVSWTLSAQSPNDPAWDRIYEAGVEQGFARLRKELARPKGIEITSEVRRGEVITSILQTVKDSSADLLAAGSHSQNVIDRLIIGSTTAQLLRASPCSVLVAPPDKSAASSTAEK